MKTDNTQIQEQREMIKRNIKLNKQYVTTGTLLKLNEKQNKAQSTYQRIVIN